MNTLQLCNGHTLVVSPSQLDSFKACPRMWRHRYIDLRTKAAAAPARDGGKVFDAAMNLRYTRMGRLAPDAACTAMMEKAVVDAFKDIDMPPDEWRTPVRYQEALRLYNEHYGEETFEVLGVQLPFEVALGSVPVSREFWARLRDVPSSRLPTGGMLLEVVYIRLHGILDLLIRDRQSGNVYVCDTKTSEKWGATQQAAYDNSAQMKSYAWAVPQMRMQLGDAAGPPWATLPNVVHGCMVNAVVLRQPYKRANSANAANAIPRTEFHRFIVHYSPERLEEWRLDTLKQCRKMLECVAEDHYEQNEMHCNSHFGRKCDFIDVCCAPKVQRAMILSSDIFTDYKRGPLAEKAAAVQEETTT